MRSITTVVSSCRNAPSIPSFFPCRIARRMILRSTYPRPSLPGITPSATRNVVARRWSAMTRSETSSLGSPP